MPRKSSIFIASAILAATAFLTACNVQVGNTSFSSKSTWTTNDGDGRLVLTPGLDSRASGNFTIDVRSWKKSRNAGIPIEIVEGNHSRGWFFQNAQQVEQLRNLPTANAPVAATLPSDAGNLELDGHLADGKASGTYRFVANLTFAAEAEKILARKPTDLELMECALSDVSLSYIRGLAEIGLVADFNDILTLRRHGVSLESAREFADLGFKRDEIIKLRAHGIQPTLVTETRAQGYGKTVDDLTKLRAHGVTPALLKDWKDNDFTPTVEEVVKLRAHGLQPSYAAAWKKAGFDFSYDDLIKARAHGVPVEFAAAVQKSGATLKTDDLIRLRQFGVTPEYFTALKDFNPAYTTEDMVRFRQHGITPEWLAGVKKAGYTFEREELIRLKQYGVQPDYLAALNVPGRKQLDVASILELRNRGVTPETARRLRE